jgi:prepilin-type processing-associated H-X9-DG protein
MQCSNNLKQLGIAAQAYESAHGQFPFGAGIVNMSDSGAPFPVTNNNGLGCLAYLLPYIEQNNVHSQLRVNWDPYGTAAGSLWSQNAANTIPARTRIKTFECPSAQNQVVDGYLAYHRMRFAGGSVNFQAALFAASANLGITNYIGVAGRFGMMGSNLTTGGEPHDAWRGVFVPSMVLPVGAPLVLGAIQRSGSVSNLTISDGTSNTLMFGETVGDGLAQGATGPFMVKVAWSWMSAGARPTFDGLQNPATRDFGAFGSSHTGGAVNFLFCDGSVRTLRAPTSGTTTTMYVNTSSIRRGEIIDWNLIGG